ncbi:hypothetical protein IJO12_08585 [bacterium]|nr:hypothetical protein [bacterium]
MRKLFFILTILISFNNFVLAGEYALIENNKIQNHINEIGTQILNSNRLEKRVVFVYDDEEKMEYLKDMKSLTKRQVVVYEHAYKSVANDDELAAYISREIPNAIRSYDGIGNGWLSSVKIKAAPKKYELVFDKLAVDYMVKAGYNPLGLITYINKTSPQVRQDRFSNKNLTSKRLAYIYEKIYSQYPNFLINNEYIDNEYYQNFLLTSLENRKKVKQKVDNPKMNKGLKYE